MNLQSYAIKGTYYSIGVEALKDLIFLGVSLLLARLLYPEQFGVIAIVLGYLRFFNIVSNGAFESAIIRISCKNDDYLSFIFWISLSFGIFFFLFSFFCAPILAKAFNVQLLAILLPVASVTLISDSLFVVPKALFLKNLDIEWLTLVQSFKLFLYGGSTITLAFSGYGIWSVVIGYVIASYGACLYAYVKTTWRPRLTLSGYDEVIGFVTSIYLLRIMHIIRQNFHLLIIGLFLGLKELGFFYFACKAGEFFSQKVLFVLLRVLYPVLCKYATDDKKKLNAFVQHAVKYLNLYSLPVYCGLAFGSYHIIVHFYGERWLPAVRPLQIMCISYFLSGYTKGIFSQVFLSQKKFPFLYLTAGILGLGINAFAVLFGVRFGILGVAYALVSVDFALLITGAIYFHHISDFDWGKCIKQNAPFVTATVLSVLFYKLAEPFVATHLIMVIVNILCAMVVYYIALKVFGVGDILFIRKLFQKKEQKAVLY